MQPLEGGDAALLLRSIAPSGLGLAVGLVVLLTSAARTASVAADPEPELLTPPNAERPAASTAARLSELSVRANGQPYAATIGASDGAQP